MNNARREDMKFVSSTIPYFCTYCTQNKLIKKLYLTTKIWCVHVTQQQIKIPQIKLDQQLQAVYMTEILNCDFTLGSLAIKFALSILSLCISSLQLLTNYFVLFLLFIKTQFEDVCEPHVCTTLSVVFSATVLQYTWWYSKFFWIFCQFWFNRTVKKLPTRNLNVV